MYKFLILLLIISSSLNSISQGETKAYAPKKWMVKSILFSQPYIYKNNKSFPNFFTGIGVKRYFGEVGARFSFERILNSSKETIGAVPYTQNYLGAFEENAFRIGTEYKKNYYDFINLHFFVDYIYTIYEGESNTFTTIGDVVLHQKLRGNTHGAIIGMGFDYLFSEHLSIGLETRIEILNNRGNYFKKDFVEQYTINYFSSNNELNLRLLGNLSLNYHF